MHDDRLEGMHASGSWMPKLEKYLPEMVYGSMDGIVTTFAVVAGSAGADLTINIVLILGISNLLADGLSMSIGSYLSKKSELDNYNKHVKIEEWEIDNMPDTERQEVMDIFKEKGFSGEELDMVVNRITSNRKVWVDTMMKDELGLIKEKKSPFRAGLSTFISFVIAGGLPLIVYLFAFSGNLGVHPFMLSSVVTLMAFVLIGYVKKYVTQTGLLRSISETLFLGASAAAVAYLLGDYLERLLS
jgi:VIT1/CCC1 family predicted Fe2+/Mn2+ transporter